MASEDSPEAPDLGGPDLPNALSEPARCNPETPPRCSEGIWLSCGEDMSEVRVACPLGCAETPGTCEVLAASNGLTPPSEAVARTRIATTLAAPRLLFDADNGRIYLQDADNIFLATWDPNTSDPDRPHFTFEHVDQTADGMPALGVFSFGDLEVGVGTTLRAKGNAALVLNLAGSASIAGTIDISATPQGPGPGGFAGDCDYLDGCDNNPTSGAGPGGGESAPDPDGLVEDGGGGGASFGTLGGHGGGHPWLENVARGAAGTLYGSPTLEPLVGGSGGGSGGEFSGGGGAGGWRRANYRAV